MKTTTTTQLQKLLDKRFGGLLASGSHEPDGAACALELLSQARGGDWSDKPSLVRCFDLRPLNDAFTSSLERTKYVLPVAAAYDGSLDWPVERQRKVIEQIIILTVQRVISELPSLPAKTRADCRRANTLPEARTAAAEAADAAEAAEARAARYAALKTVCEIWMDAAQYEES